MVTASAIWLVVGVATNLRSVSDVLLVLAGRSLQDRTDRIRTGTRALYASHSRGQGEERKIDSRKIALLLRGGNMPIAFAYPKQLRATRDLLRRRMFLMRRRP
jgi:hypothetical protein